MCYLTLPSEEHITTEKNRPLKLVVRKDLRNKICSSNLSVGNKMAVEGKQAARMCLEVEETYLKDNGSGREMCVQIVAIC